MINEGPNPRGKQRPQIPHKLIFLPARLPSRGHPRRREGQRRRKSRSPVPSEALRDVNGAACIAFSDVGRFGECGVRRNLRLFEVIRMCEPATVPCPRVLPAFDANGDWPFFLSYFIFPRCLRGPSSSWRIFIIIGRAYFTTRMSSLSCRPPLSET